MAERYTRVFSLRKNLYTEGCPVVIGAGALLKDNETMKMLVQLKFRSLTDSVIVAIKVNLTLSDPAGTVLGEKEFQYLDLKLRRNEEFGSKIPIYLSHPTTRSYSARVTEVVTTDGGVWKETENAEWIPMPEAMPLAKMGDSEFIKQFGLTYRNVKEVWPARFLDLWQCGCGEINRIGNEICRKCKNSRDQMLSADRGEIMAARDARLKKEKEERDRIAAIEAKARQEEAARRLAKKRKRAKIARCILIPLFSVIILAAAALAFFHFRGMQLAERYLQAGDFTSARESVVVRFTTDKVDPNLVPYLDAGAAMERGEYADAERRFAQLYSYRDSTELRDECAYIQAEQEFAKKNWAEAEEKYLALGDYKDSAEKAKECVYLSAMQLMEQTEYDKARTEFEKLKRQAYKDADDMINECWYREGKALLDAGKYSDAIAKLDTPAKKKYRDSVDLILSAVDAVVDNMIQTGQYTKAADYAENLVTYGKEGAAEEIKKIRMDGAAYYQEKKNNAAALTILEPLKRKDAEVKQLYQSIQYTTAQEWVSAGTNVDKALSYLKELENQGYKQAKGSYSKAQGSYYKLAQKKYRANSYATAKTIFNALGSYSKSKDYLILINMHNKGYVSQNDLKKVCGMEDANDMLLGYYYEEFLKARWSNSNSWYFEFYTKEGSLWSRTNLSVKYDGYYYAFKDGIYYEYDKNATNRYEHKNFKFTIVNWNTVKVYSYKNGTTYTLYRN